MADLLVDTDVFVDHLRGARLLRVGRNRVHVSVITRCELLAGTSASAAITRMLEPFRELVIDRQTAERAGRIRRETGTRTPDALIAASALVHRLTLVTRNRRHFDPVRGLRIRDPL